MRSSIAGGGGSGYQNSGISSAAAWLASQAGGMAAYQRKRHIFRRQRSGISKNQRVRGARRRQAISESRHREPAQSAAAETAWQRAYMAMAGNKLKPA